MTILITGIAGFIGSNFLKYVMSTRENEMVIGLDKLTYAGNLNNIFDEFDRSNFKFIKGDIANIDHVSKVFERYRFDTVVNFAAESHVDRSISNPQIFVKTNILGTQILLDQAKKQWYHQDTKDWDVGKKYIQISTDEVYGTLGSDGYFAESTPLDPHSPYSASKASADMIVKSYFDTFGMPINITRCSNNYGPYQFPEKLIPLMIMNALEHKPLPIYGDGKQVRDWLYVDDHCRAIDIVMNGARSGEVYNIGGHNEMENIQIVTKILDILSERTGDDKIGPNLISYVEDRLGHDRRYAIDPKKIGTDLGWEPTVLFNEGIEITVDWYLSNRKWMENIISGNYLNLEFPSNRIEIL